VAGPKKNVTVGRRGGRLQNANRNVTVPIILSDATCGADDWIRK
jgi:hypothetical protein